MHLYIKEFLWQRGKTNVPIEHLAILVAETPSTLQEIVELSTNINNENVNWRAAWILAKVADINIELIQQFSAKLILFVNNNYKICYYGQLRELLKTINFLTYTEQEDGILLNCCTQIFKSKQFTLASRVTAMYICANIVAKYSELKDELIAELAIRIQENKSIQAAYRKIIKQLAKQ